MKKTEAIREVAKQGFAMTNKQIQQEVRSRYGLFVGSNEIINAIGSHEKRLKAGGQSRELINKAKEFLFVVRDIKLCFTLLRIAESEVFND